MYIRVCIQSGCSKLAPTGKQLFFFPPKKALCLPFLLTALLPGTAQHSSNLSCLHHLFEVYFWDAWVLDMKDERLAADFASRGHSVFQISRLASFVTKLYRKMHFCVTANVQTLSPNSLLCATAWAFLFFFLWLFNFALFLPSAAASVSCLHHKSTQPTPELRALPSDTHAGWWNPSAAQPQRGMAQ